MSAIVPNNGPSRQLDTPAEPNEQVTPEQVQDADRMARLLMRILRDVAALKRRWWPRRVEFEDIAVDNTGTTKYRFRHNFSGRVRWYPVGWRDGALCANLIEDSDTDSNTLVLVSYETGTLTLRVEEAG